MKRKLSVGLIAAILLISVSSVSVVAAKGGKGQKVADENFAKVQACVDADEDGVCDNFVDENEDGICDEQAKKGGKFGKGQGKGQNKGQFQKVAETL